MPKNTPLKRASFRLPDPALHKRAAIAARMGDMTIAEFYRQAVAEKLAKKGAK